MKNIILLLIALICISAGIYFDQILAILGSMFGFYAWFRGDEESLTKYVYIQLLLLLTYTGLVLYAIIGLAKDALLMIKELLGPQPDFLYYLIIIALYLTLFVAGKLLSNKISKIILRNND